MSEHKAAVRWNRDGREFTYEAYSRAHVWEFQNGVRVEASAAPDFLGDAERIDPEEAFVASLSSCHMLTFLAIAAKKRLTVESYEDDAVGYLEKNDDGKLAITRVELRPRVVFAGDAPTDEEIGRIHDKSHHACFIANSVKTDVVVT